MRSNLPLLESIAEQLGPLLPELVFVGGIAPLHLTSRSKPLMGHHPLRGSRQRLY